MPPVVKVFVNGELMGTTKPSPDGRGSLMVERIPHGLVRVDLASEGYGGLSEKVLIRPAQVFAWQPNLPKVALPNGKIELQVTPTGARITLDDDEVTSEEGRAILSLEDGVKKDLFISANNFQPMRRTIGPLKPGSTAQLEVQLTMERWSLEVIPDPPDARVVLQTKGKDQIDGKGAQMMRSLAPTAEVFARVSKRRCTTQKQRVKSGGSGTQRLEVKLRCR